MSSLIPIQHRELAGAAVQTVDARELHGFLEVKSEFRNWVKNRIDDFGFAEGQDFVTTVEIYRGGERKDYHLTLDMAKELAMVERNAKGKEARAYFIECERKAKAAPDPMVALNDPATMRGLLLSYSEKVIALQGTVAEQAPKVAALNRLAEAEGAISITDAAKNLQIRPKDLFRWLHANQWIYRRAGGAHWVAYQNRLQQGVLMHKVTTVERGDGSAKQVEQVLVTSKGIVRLAEIVSAKAA